MLPLADISADATSWVFILWMLILGGAIGSFLNVVVYRVPAGISIVSPPSHCPKCKQPIRWYDNVPVLGWLHLRGRCRGCNAPISARYPLVEAISAVIFLALAIAAGPLHGANLPGRPIGGDALEPAVCAVRSFELLAGMALYQAFLLATLLCAALIDYDAARASKDQPRKAMWAKLFVPAMLVGLVVPIAFGEALRPVGSGLLPDFFAAVGDGLLGIAAGATLGFLPVVLRHRASDWPVAWALMGIGLFLGWQAACALALVGLLGYLVGQVIPAARRLPTLGWLGLGTLGWILLWGQIAAKLPWVAPICRLIERRLN